MTNEHIAYIAGFLDGEGYITIRRANRGTARNPSYRLVIGFTNTYLPVLEWIKSVVGAGCINTKPRKDKEKHSPAFELTIHQREVQRQLLTEVLKFAIIKRHQIALGLAFLDLGKVKKEVVEIRGKSWPKFLAIKGDVETREQFKTHLTLLNRRGPAIASGQ
jgi:hypothetical protein